MTEKLLHFIWQHRHFQPSGLVTRQGEMVQIISPGEYNRNQGPDFSEARVQIGSTTWAGTVELHLKTSDWDKHGHSPDKNYRNVILHVVWEDDGGTDAVPVLELHPHVPGVLLKRYEQFMQNSGFIPCTAQLSSVMPDIWPAFREKLIRERLERKAAQVLDMYQQSGQHWEETAWWMIARQFGIRVNADAFEAMARSLPLSIVARHQPRILQLEALLCGQAGLLEDHFRGNYPLMLQKEYAYLRKKYNLQPISHPLHFLRMRPSAFPGVRLAQLAAFMQEQYPFFTRFKESAAVDEVKKMFRVQANDYWHYHYRFDEESVYQPKSAGEQLCSHILINGVIPLLFAYGKYHSDTAIQQKMLMWLQGLPAESNQLIRRFKELNIIPVHAAGTQALLELHQQYCENRRCLECAAGMQILGRNQLH